MDNGRMGTVRVSQPQPSQARRRAESIPRRLRKEATEIARSLSQTYRADFVADHKLKDRVLRLLRAMLPPRPRKPGHPHDPEITKAAILHSRIRRQHSEARPAEILDMVCAALQPEYASLAPIARRDMRAGLRARLRSRWRKRPRNSAWRKSR